MAPVTVGRGTHGRLDLLSGTTVTDTSFPSAALELHRLARAFTRCAALAPRPQRIGVGPHQKVSRLEPPPDRRSARPKILSRGGSSRCQCLASTCRVLLPRWIVARRWARAGPRLRTAAWGPSACVEQPFHERRYRRSRAGCRRRTEAREGLRARRQARRAPPSRSPCSRARACRRRRQPV